MKDDAKQAAHETKHISSKQDKSSIGRWKTKKFNTCKSGKDAKQAAHEKHKSSKQERSSVDRWKTKNL